MGDGWCPIPLADVAAIKAAWTLHVQQGNELVIPVPSRTWRGQALENHRQHPDIVVEFASKLLSAFRCCTKPGERLWVIEWQHEWYFLDPHVTSLGEWPYSALPDGDACHIVAPDFRFGVVMGWRTTGPVTLFGAEFLAAFAADPPERFLHACGPGQIRYSVSPNVAK